MARLAEFSYQSGSEAEFEAYVRAEFPQCIARDENGDEIVPVRYVSAYDHVVGVEYIPGLQLNPQTAPANQALMVDWHQEPENTDQAGRIETRVLFVYVKDRIPNTPPNQDILAAIRAGEATIAESGYPGVVLLTVSTRAWLGAPRPPGEVEDVLTQARAKVPDVAKAIENIEKVRPPVIPPGRGGKPPGQQGR